MTKMTTLALIAGLVTVATILPSSAQIAVPGGPNNPPPALGSSYDCTNEVGHVRPVTVSEINEIHDRKVWLYPICEEMSVLPNDNYGTLFLDGNANTLRRPIARNETLMTALSTKGYDQHDVISVVFAAGNSVLVYVHQRDMN